jgi:hypothetical protein
MPASRVSTTGHGATFVGMQGARLNHVFVGALALFGALFPLPATASDAGTDAGCPPATNCVAGAGPESGGCPTCAPAREGTACDPGQTCASFDEEYCLDAGTDAGAFGICCMPLSSPGCRLDPQPNSAGCPVCYVAPQGTPCNVQSDCGPYGSDFCFIGQCCRLLNDCQIGEGTDSAGCPCCPYGTTDCRPTKSDGGIVTTPHAQCGCSAMPDDLTLAGVALTALAARRRTRKGSESRADRADTSSESADLLNEPAPRQR